MIANLLLLFAILTITASALIGWSRAGRDGRTGRLDWLEAAFLSILTTVILSGSTATLLGQLGRFSVLNVALILMGVGVIALVLQWRSWRADRSALLFQSIQWQDWLLLLLLAFCAVVYFRPHEYIFGGGDAGTYTNIAATLVRTGGFVESGPWIDLLMAGKETTLRYLPPPNVPSQLQFVGWYIDDTAQVLPQFLPFHSALAAIAIGAHGAISAAGMMGGLLLVSLWGVLSIAAVYLLSRHLFGRTVALLAALFVAVTPTQIFFARYPTTEPLTLLLLFSGLLAFYVLWDDRNRHPYWGIFGGAALGAAMLTRIDLPVVFGLIVVALIWRLWEGRWHRGWAAYIITVAVFLLHLAAIIWQMNWPYALNTYGAVIRYIDWRLVLAASGVGLLVAVILLILQRRSLDRTDLPSSLVRWLESSPVRWSLIGVTIGLSLFAYFLYPALSPPATATAWPGNVDFPVLNSENWVRIGWYITPLGLVMATLGLAAILRREPLGKLAVFLLIGVLTTMQYVYNIFNTPYHIYAMRRYVPIVLPMLMIYAAYLTGLLYQMRPRVVMRAVAALSAIALVLGMGYQSRIIVTQRDFAGSAAQLAGLNEQLKQDAILVFAEGPEGLFADTFGVPLHHQFGHDVLTLREEDGDVEQMLAAAFDYAAEEDKPLQLITSEPVFPSMLDALHLKPVTMVSLSTDMLQNTFEGYPSIIQQVDHGIEIYDIVNGSAASDGAAGTVAPTNEAIEIDVGTLDSIYLRDGFYDKEALPGSPSMRWTSGEASVSLPMPLVEEIVISVDVMRYLPDGVDASPVEIWLDGQLAGTFTPGSEWQTHTFSITQQPQPGASVLRFETETFNPAAIGISQDARELGFLIDRIRIEAAEE